MQAKVSVLVIHFNSIKVRLKQPNRIERKCLARDFNSIKVRLKLYKEKQEVRHYQISIP